jgi:hypothetical protein
LSNINWIVTVIGYTIGNVFLALVYFIHKSELDLDDQAKKNDFEYLLSHVLAFIVYVWIAYQSDSHKKMNFVKEN